MSKTAGTTLPLFADKLRELRLRSGLTQEEFAAATFCSPDYITKMERGLRLPSAHLLQALMKSLAEAGVEPASLSMLEELLIASKVSPSRDLPTQPQPVQTENQPADERKVAPFNILKEHTLLFGRQASLDKVTQIFQADRQSVVAITGLGGIGKSALAWEAVQQLSARKVFDKVLWESAKTLELADGLIRPRPFVSNWPVLSPGCTFEGLLDSLALQLAYPELLDEPLETKIQKLQAIFASQACLIVLDNLESCEQPGLILTYLAQLLQNSSSGLLATLRESPHPFNGVGLPLDLLDEAAALALLRDEIERRPLPDLDPTDHALVEALQEVVGLVGGHPLTLKLVAAYLERHSLDRILDKLRSGYADRLDPEAGESGGLYSFIYKKVWQGLNTASRHLLLKSETTTDLIDEQQLLELFKASQPPRSPDELLNDFDLSLKELVQTSLLQVSGGLHKYYRFWPLTLLFLNTGLPQYWQGQEAGC